MVINVISVQYNGEFLLKIILLTLCYYHRSWDPIKYHE